MTWYLFLMTSCVAGGLLFLRSWHQQVKPDLSARISPFLHASPQLDFVSQVIQKFSESKLVAHPRSPWGSTRVIEELLRVSSAGITVRAFRLKQLTYIASAAGVAFAWLTLRSLANKPVGLVFAIMFVGMFMAVGGWLAVWQLQDRARARTKNADAVLPTFLELMAFTVGAGEPVVAAMQRATCEISGPFAQAVHNMNMRLQAGENLVDGLRYLDQQFASSALSRTVRTFEIAIERGTPLADVLRAQAHDARATYSRELMILAGKKETAMLLPVVFFILPMIVAVAIYPGLIALKVL